MFGFNRFLAERAPAVEPVQPGDDRARAAWPDSVRAVICGAGLGLLPLLVLGDLIDFGGGFSQPVLLGGIGLAAMCLALDLGGSWQSRQSWRSPATALALVLYPALAAYALAVYVVGPFAVRIATGAVVAVLALAVLIARGLKTPCARALLEPAAFLSHGLYAGALIAALIARLDGRPLLPFAAVVLVLLALAAVVNGLRFKRFKAPHAEIRSLRYLFVAFAFAIPMVILGLDLDHPVALAAALASALGGLVIERRLGKSPYT